MLREAGAGEMRYLSLGTIPALCYGAGRTHRPKRRALVPGRGQGAAPGTGAFFRGPGPGEEEGRHFPVGCAGLGMSSLP